MTWRVTHHREGSPHPVSHYWYGEQAEAEARKRTDELAGQPNVNRVEVDRIERSGTEGRPVFSLGSLSQLRLAQSVEKCALKTPGQRHFEGSERSKITRLKRETPGQGDFYVNGGFDA